MSFNLFGPATKCDIRVGYIDPERGFVGNLTVYEANKYAKLKKALDRWGNEEMPYDFWDMPPDDANTMKEQVLYKIWDKARHGNLRCMEILAQLGCLDDK